jgi:hypothetical protein
VLGTSGSKLMFFTWALWFGAGKDHLSTLGIVRIAGSSVQLSPRSVLR